MDLGLILRRKKTGEIILAAGGRWHTLEKKYLTDETGRRLPPRKVRYIDLEESQVEFTRWFATFIADLRDGRPRDVSLALAAGDRRGGKTFDLLICTIALLIDIPRLDGSATLGWVAGGDGANDSILANVNQGTLSYLGTVDLGGTAARRVTASLGAQDVRDPHVSADGRAVAYLLDDRRGDGPQTTLQRLVLAQDTGSAIVGAVRADWFAGWGHEAGELAGRLKQPLRLWVLWPR